MTCFDSASRGTGRLLALMMALGALVSLGTPAQVARAWSRPMRLEATAAGFTCQAVNGCMTVADCDSGELCEWFYPGIPSDATQACVELATTPVCCDDMGSCPERPGSPPPTCQHLTFAGVTTFTGVCVYETSDWCPEGPVIEDEDIEECFTYADGTPAESYSAGDCDGDGIPNGSEVMGQLCVSPAALMDGGVVMPTDAGLDAEAPEDAGPSLPDASADAEPPSPDAEPFDSGSRPGRDAGDGDDPSATVGNFRGTGGCTCDVARPRALAGDSALALLVGLALLRRRRA